MSLLMIDPRQPAKSDSANERDLGFLWDYWYPALRSTQLYKLTKATLLEVPLAIGRHAHGTVSYTHLTLPTTPYV